MKKQPVLIVAVKDKIQISHVQALAKEIWREHYRTIVEGPQIDYMLEKFQSEEAIAEQMRNGTLYYLLKADEMFAGYFSVFPKFESDELFLSKFYVRKEARGKGYGRKAMDFIEALARKKRLPKITLTVNKQNTDSIKAYEKMGFRITEAIVQQIGNGFVMDDYRMEKAVADTA